MNAADDALIFFKYFDPEENEKAIVRFIGHRHMSTLGLACLPRFFESPLFTWFAADLLTVAREMLDFPDDIPLIAYEELSARSVMQLPQSFLTPTRENQFQLIDMTSTMKAAGLQVGVLISISVADDSPAWRHCDRAEAAARAVLLAASHRASVL